MILLAASVITSAHAITNTVGIEIELIPEEELIQLKPVGDARTPEPQLTVSEQLDQSNLPQQNLWVRIQARYAIPTITSVHTKKYETRYASDPAYVEAMIQRSKKYLFYVVEEIEKRNMPSEIALLPMIESAYKPHANSRSSAAGIWQFMPATGRHYGLKQTWWVDKRRDVTASTEAALSYLEKLHGMFNDWHLALAAYNAGEGTVSRAIASNKKAGLPTDYQSLTLPKETRHYVPKLQAIKNIVNQPEYYGLIIEPIDDQAYFVEVEAPKHIDKKLAAQFAEIPETELQSLNPSFHGPVIASRHHNHRLLLPVESAALFSTNLANHNQRLSQWTTYNAKGGESIASIAKKFKTSSTNLKKVNKLTHSKVSENRPLLVPNHTNKEANFAIANLDYKVKVPSKRRARTITHKVRKGDTISGIAKRYHVKAEQILKMNRLKSSRIKIGQLLKLTASSAYLKKKRSYSQKKRISSRIR